MKFSRIEPRTDLAAIKVPNATPELVEHYALTDEQALLAKVRYNRLIDIFFGLATYSLQNHLRTTVEGMGQVEIDEVYVGINKNGAQFVIPVQGKGGKDNLGVIQTLQDFACCKEKFPDLICRPVSAQFLAPDRIALFELSVGSKGESVEVVEERHYHLVPADEIGADELRAYGNRS